MLEFSSIREEEERGQESFPELELRTQKPAESQDLALPKRPEKLKKI